VIEIKSKVQQWQFQISNKCKVVGAVASQMENAIISLLLWTHPYSNALTGEEWLKCVVSTIWGTWGAVFTLGTGNTSYC
jgi:hypothetical protein